MNKITQIKNNAVLEGLVLSQLLKMYAVKNDDKKTFELADKVNYTDYLRMTDIGDEEEIDNLKSVIRSFANKFVQLEEDEENTLENWTEENKVNLQSITDPKSNVIKLKSMYTELLETEEE